MPIQRCRNGVRWCNLRCITRNQPAEALYRTSDGNYLMRPAEEGERFREIDPIGKGVYRDPLTGFLWQEVFKVIPGWEWR